LLTAIYVGYGGRPITASTYPRQVDVGCGNAASGAGSLADLPRILSSGWQRVEPVGEASVSHREALGVS
jgi:hypothetical protein